VSRSALPRLLHIRSQHGYTSSMAEALAHEPEAVTADEQRELTKRAHASTAARDRELIEGCAQRISVELSALSTGARSRRVSSHVRAMQRQVSILRDLARAQS
jgi:hypothetical protein